MIKKLLFVFWVIVFPGSSFAQNKNPIDLIDCENPAEWTGKVVLNERIRRTGKFSFETFGNYPTKTEFKEFIPINSESTYVLTCYMRSLDSENKASGYMGLNMYDKDKKLISIDTVAIHPGTESELVVQAVKGTTELVISKNVECLKYKHLKVAFNIKKNYADLPNFKLSPRVKKIVSGKDQLKIHLVSPLNENYKSGTKIRFHLPWNAPFYWAAKGWMPVEWKKFSITLKGIAAFGVSKKKFWKGTKYVKPFFWFGNWDHLPKAGAKLLVDDFSFVKSK